MKKFITFPLRLLVFLAICLSFIMFGAGGIIVERSLVTRNMGEYEAVCKLDSFPSHTKQIASFRTRYEAREYILRCEAVRGYFRYSLLPKNNRYFVYEHSRNFTYRKPTYEGFKNWLNAQ